MGKDIDISTNQEHFVREALKLGIRTDGRSLLESRKPIISLSPDLYGFVEIEWGLTKLAVRISAEILQPYEDRPFEGLFTINTEISPMASPHFENGKNTDDEVLISRLIEKAIRRSNALDLESLCIVAGSKVWSIRADIHFLNFDGGLIDSACLGVMTALQHFKKPDISVNGEDIIIHSLDERQPVALSILHVPICVSFSFFNPGAVEENIKGDLNEEISIIDCTQQEELLRDGTLVITINKNRELIQISKSGGLPIDATMLMDLSSRALLIAEELTDMVKDLLKKDEQERYKKLNLKMLQAENSR
ncbi:exosome complex component Rrp45p [[Candida] railenensis]|uniref:Exosome complex component RRP45 n=1 Tax=[Candida] railenensis TaxID=45579 RepID=A0A9P0QTC1_9ASCO|nr:exosome complex component Rrp45p [[Candida] railenensis]